MKNIQTENTCLQLYPSAAAAWRAMYRDCATATESIELEQYILKDDPVGRSFLKLFVRKAQQGLTVRLVLDSIGSRTAAGSPLVEKLRAAGGDIRFFNPHSFLYLLSPSRLLPRNHAKTMVIDSKVGYIGGVCFAAYMRTWREMHVRLTGSLIKDIRQDFANLWSSLAAGKRSWSDIKISHKKMLRYFANRPTWRLNPLYHELMQQIRQADKRILLVTPYFMPPRRLLRELKAAAERGVMVHIMTSAVTDVSLADRVARSYFPSLIQSGVKIHLFHKTVLHAKYAVIDCEWATVGSMNLDYLSLLYNREANLIIRDPDAVAAFADRFAVDSAETVRAVPADWYTMSLWDRFVGRLGRALRRFL
ncbi:MAG: phosphatidylserine/phosphatidylglycerophosphate/cardiolipin synthase family protein [Bdellovibrionales bacterium]